MATKWEGAIGGVPPWLSLDAVEPLPVFDGRRRGYKDGGCEVFSSCLECPLPKCIEEVKVPGLSKFAIACKILEGV